MALRARAAACSTERKPHGQHGHGNGRSSGPAQAVQEVCKAACISPHRSVPFLPGQPAACRSACISLGKMKSRGWAARSQLVCRKPRANTCHDMGSLPDNAIRAVRASPSPTESSAHPFLPHCCFHHSDKQKRSLLSSPSPQLLHGDSRDHCCSLPCACTLLHRRTSCSRMEAPSPSHPSSTSTMQQEMRLILIPLCGNVCRQPPPPDPKLTATPWQTTCCSWSTATPHTCGDVCAAPA